MNKKIDMAISAIALGIVILCTIVCEGERIAWGCCSVWIIKSMILVANQNS